MEESVMVTIYTQVYNTKPYLRQCVESVLHQTYPHFEYYLIDNGSTDGCKEILEEYAAADRRIKLLRNEKNQLPPIGVRIPLEEGLGRYYTDLDSDDWWEPDFLERLIGFLEAEDLDIACTGSMVYFQEQKSERVNRKLPRRVALTRQEFAEQYHKYGMFPNTIWGSVMKRELLRPVSVGKPYPFGVDTVYMLEYLKRCRRIGIDDSALYHYRVSPRSLTFLYDPRRFDGILFRRDRIGQFLEQHQAMTPEMRGWWMVTHLLYMVRELELLRDSTLEAQEKLRQCARFSREPMTPQLMGSSGTDPQVTSLQRKWRTAAWEILLRAAPSVTEEPAEDWDAVTQVLCPQCRSAVRPDTVSFFAGEEDLRAPLLADDKKALFRRLLHCLRDGEQAADPELGALALALVPEDSPFCTVSDPQFFVEYADLCSLLLEGNYLFRLEDMTGSLMSGRALALPVDYLNLYLTLAVLTEQVPAFLFGKLRLAETYLELGQREPCQAVLRDLEEMGMADNEELQALRRRLQAL